MELAFNSWAVVSLFAFVINIILGFVIFSKNPRGRLNRLYLLLVTFVAIWCISEFFQRLTPYTVDELGPDSFAAFTGRISWTGVVLGSFVMIHFSRALARIKKGFLGGIHFPVILYAVGVVFAVVIFATDLFISGAGYAEWGAYTSTREGNPAYSAYMVVYCLMAFLVSYFLIGAIRHSASIIESSQLKLAFIGLFVLVVGGGITQVLLPMFIQGGLPAGSLLSIFMTLCFGYDMLKYKMFDIEAVVEDASIGGVETLPRLELGFSYLIKERGTHYSYEIFRGMVSSTPGLCVTTFYPPKFRDEYRLQKTPIIWLTETQTNEKTIKADRLDFELSYTITSFMKDNEKTVVLIDDLKYLALVNGFDKTVAFLKAINDVASINSATIIAPITPELFEESEFTQLESIFDQNPTMLSDAPIQDAEVAKPGYAYLIKEEKPTRTYDLAGSQQGTRPILCYTKTYPDKVKKLYKLQKATFYWISSSSTEPNVLDPTRLQFEVEMTLVEFIKKSKNGLVVIDGLEQFVLSTSFEPVSDFLKVIVDVASVNAVTLIVPISPKAFEPVEMAILEKRFDFVLTGEDGE